jgi:hypothetical protein
MLPDWSSAIITATVGRAMELPLRSKTKSCPVPGQRMVTDPADAVVPAAPPVIANQMRASVYGVSEWGTVMRRAHRCRLASLPHVLFETGVHEQPPRRRMWSCLGRCMSGRSDPDLVVSDIS